MNAYATIGGHVYLFKGLLQELPHENALAMLMAHEYSHVQLRHTAKGIGSGLAVALTTVVLPGDTSFDNPFFGLTSQLTSTHFSRDMEADADLNGLIAVEKLYGHVNGADDLFELFMRQRGEASENNWEAFFSTHPLDQDRIDALANFAVKNDFATMGEIVALPENFKRWLAE